jgi:UDP-N-acetylglucosamine--N-acetylmuramyl-(pentapeptide) pyrophosphoryl-undecaprenol N-acetylglucosamine transferase
MNSLLMPIIIVAARSGGHIIPACTLADQYYAGRPLYAITSSGALDQSLISAHHRVVHHSTLPFSAAPLVWYQYPAAVITFLWSVISCMLLFWQTNPCVVITTGGAIGIPAACAARILAIPCELYELNAVPGRASCVIARIAQRVYTVFPETQRYPAFSDAQMRVYPVQYAEKDRISRVEAKKRLGIDPAQKVLLILGGSQGAERLNQALSRVVGSAHFADIVLHQTGKNSALYSEYYKNKRQAALVRDFVDRETLALWYSAADYAITRAGSGTIHELIFFTLRTTLVPLIGSGAEHQTENAHAAVRHYPDLFICAGETEEALSAALIAYHTGNAL